MDVADSSGAAAGANGSRTSGSLPCLYSSAIALLNAQLSSPSSKNSVIEDSHIEVLEL